MKEIRDGTEMKKNARQIFLSGETLNNGRHE